MRTVFRTGRFLSLVFGTGVIALTLQGNAQSVMMQSSKPNISDPASDHANVRGVIVGLVGRSLVVKTRDGGDMAITLSDDCLVNSVAMASINDIKPGDFVGISNVPKSEGMSSALEVVIFPAALKGTGEGDRPWDLKPNSSMTNATVANTVKGVDGRTVTVTYQGGGQKRIDIPDKTPIVTLSLATMDDLKSGATVFVPAEHGSDGTWTTHRVVFGTNGVVPPM
ncbi:Cu/Ag efflux protein CusF [Phyllobacterium sp. 1468]|uniref:hypothetical protein n=1 Tax=Phyllobacterium sp. 1468 TaxID=2817759 RepID=UPI001AE43A47|nr:Cu/Ag efflux protein CusF [Phyllobacterium sp. 1468]